MPWQVKELQALCNLSPTGALKISVHYLNIFLFSNIFCDLYINVKAFKYLTPSLQRTHCKKIYRCTNTDPPNSDTVYLLYSNEAVKRGTSLSLSLAVYKKKHDDSKVKFNFHPGETKCPRCRFFSPCIFFDVCATADATPNRTRVSHPLSHA